MSLLKNSPNGWELKTFNNALSVLKDGTHFSPKVFGGKNLYITSKNIRMGKLDLEDVSYISDDDHQRIYSSSPVKYGDVLLTKDGAKTGNVCINSLKKEFSLLSSVAYLRGKTDVLLNEFLMQWLSSPRVQFDIKNDMAGQAITRLTLQKIGKFKILLPPLPEQKAIADLLSTWDDAIEKTERLIQAKEKRFKCLLRELISESRMDTNNHKWKKVKLGQVANIEKKQKLKSVDGEILLTVKLHCLGIELNDRIKPKLTTRGRPYFKHHFGDFLIGRQNFHNGGFGIVPSELDGGITSNAISCLSVNESKLSKAFLWYQFANSNYYKKVGHVMDGTGQKELSDKQILKLKILLPEINEQKAIAETLSTAQLEIDLLKQLAEKYKIQKRGLMQKMLTGEWRVKPEIVKQYGNE